jgi:aspartate aminotransferase-like enzyme
MAPPRCRHPAAPPRNHKVLALLSALEQLLNWNGYEVAFGSSLAAAQRALATFSG